MLRDAIVSGQLAPGQRLVEAKLAEEMGVSRNPVREAIRRLEHEGLVEALPRAGMAVARIDLADVVQLYAVRSVLEGLAARQAAGRLTAEQAERMERSVAEGEECRTRGDLECLVKSSSDFHRTVLEAAANRRLEALMEILDVHVSRYRRLSLQAEGSPAEVLQDHRRILTVLKQGDAEQAERLMRAHLQRSGQQIIRFLGGKEGTKAFASGQAGYNLAMPVFGSR